MARDLLAPIPFREVFVILALFLPQLTFVDEAATKKELWYSVLALLLAFATPSRKRKGDEAPSEKLRRLSSPRHWDVALVPFPEEFVPLPTSTETGLACSAPWAFPPSLCVLESRATRIRVLAIAEAGDTVTADHLLQMASLAAEHKPTVLGIPGQVPIPYQLESTVVLLQSLHALFQLLTSGSTMQHCPQAASFVVALGTTMGT